MYVQVLFEDPDSWIDICT